MWSTVNARTDQGIAQGLQEYEILGDDGRVLEKRELPLRFAITDRSTFEQEAIDAGFRIRHLWGDYAYSPFEPQRSPYMIWELSS